MKIKYFIILLLVLLSFVSCTKLEIITDPYWINVVSDFTGSAAKLKIRSFFMGGLLTFSIVDVNDGVPSVPQLNISGKEIFLLSPLLSTQASVLSNAVSSNLIYYFGDEEGNSNDSTDNRVQIKRDRRKAFFEAGELLSKEITTNLTLPVIYSIDNTTQNEEALSFLDGLNSGNKIINIISVEVADLTSESDIRNFFDTGEVKNNDFIVIFSNKWKNLCYELSEKDNKNIITSDSWFHSTFSSFILFSVEDDINGMLKKVYYHSKKKILDDITLEGYIYK